MTKHIVLAVAAHPDDEALGCGGTLAWHARRGDAVHVMFLADGESARSGVVQDKIRTRREQAARACMTLGALEPRFEEFPDNRMDSVALLDVVQAVERAVREIGPTVVYAHHGGDLNVDHRIAHQAVLTACRPMPDSPIRAIYAFEVLSSTGWSDSSQVALFCPTHFVDISDTLETKTAALANYESEMRAFPHARSAESVTALARWRGASVGLRAAEAFETIRMISR